MHTIITERKTKTIIITTMIIIKITIIIIIIIIIMIIIIIIIIIKIIIIKIIMIITNLQNIIMNCLSNFMASLRKEKKY